MILFAPLKSMPSAPTHYLSIDSLWQDLAEDTQLHSSEII